MVKEEPKIEENPNIIPAAPPIKKIALRAIEEYHGDIMMNAEGKFPMSSPIREVCGFDDKDGKCKLTLYVARRKNQKFERDSGDGGQLQYDDRDVRYFKYCTKHGPFELPHSW